MAEAIMRESKILLTLEDLASTKHYELSLINFYIPRTTQNAEGGNVNKLELVSALREQTDLSKHEAAKIVDLFFDNMTDTLSRGDRVEIRGLCSFYVKVYDGYTGRNPKTGEKVPIKPKKLPFFKASKEMKERVNR